MKKYKVQLEKFKKYHFSGESRLFRRLLESSGYKNQFFWQMNHALVGIVINNVLMWKKQQMRKKSDENL